MPNKTNVPVIFLAFANDHDDTIGYLRNLPNEARNLREVLEPAEQAGLCEVVTRSNSTAGDIFKVFQDPKYRNRVAILHYGGHANGYQLLLESASGESAAADAGGLAKFLGQQQGLQLVFLNGCSTQQQTEGLLEANIPAVISTSRAIEDQVATDFSHQFYRGLAGGATIRTAYAEAEASVQMVKGGDTRGLYYGKKDDASNQPETDRWPWNLYLREGSETADQWNLPEAVDDPLFGLPSLPEQDLPESPYRHLSWFSRDDAEVFFGRGHQIRELYDRLTAPRTAPIMMFYGQSGVGKSSILDAGLIPRLEQDFEVRYLRRGEGGLVETLKLAFLPEASDVPIETAWCAKEERAGKPLIVFLDQVEELYTRPAADAPDELEQFLQLVKATFSDSDRRPKGKLVLSFRKEWLAELETQLIEYELPRTKVFLEPLDYRGIVEIVQGPAHTARLRERYGLTVEEGLAEVIADDLLADRDSAIAPTLQILLTKLWNRATEANYEHPEFTQELYQQLKRDGILLRDFLNQQIAAFRKLYPEAVDSGLLLDIVALHTTSLGTADHRTIEELQQQYAHLGATLPEILQQCQDLHLLTVAASSQKDAAKNTRLAHDTLAPLVREQFEVSDKPGQRARRILDNRSVDWEGEHEGTPLDEADLKLVERGVIGTRALSATEQRLVEASRELRAKLKRMRALLKIAGAVAVAIIAITAAIAAVGWKEAVKQKTLAIQALVEADKNRGRARELMSDLVPEVMAAVQFSEPKEKEKLVEASREYFEKFVTVNSTDGEPDAETIAVLADAKYVIGRLYRERASMGSSSSESSAETPPEQTTPAELATQAFEEAAQWQWRKLKGLKAFSDLPELSRDYLGKNLVVEDPNKGLVNDFGYTLNELGHTYKFRGDMASRNDQGEDAANFWKEAREKYTAAAAVREQLVKHQLAKEPPVDPIKRSDYQQTKIEYQLLQASAEMNIGLPEMQLNEDASALSHFMQADETRQALLRETPGDKTIIRHIALGEHNIARLLRKQGDRAKALESEDKAIADYESLATNDLTIKGELATCYVARGELRLEQLKGEIFDSVDRLLGDRYLDELTPDEAKVAIGDFIAAAKCFRELYEERRYIAQYRVNLTDLSFALIELYKAILPEEQVERPLADDVVGLLDFLRDFHLKEGGDGVDYFPLAYADFYRKIKGLKGAREQLARDVVLWKGERENNYEGKENQWVADELLAELLYRLAETLYEVQDEQAKATQAEAIVLWQALIEGASGEDRDFYGERLKETQELGPGDNVAAPSQVVEKPLTPTETPPLDPGDVAASPSKRPDSSEHQAESYVPGNLYYEVYRQLSPEPGGPVVMTWVFEGVRQQERASHVGDYLYFTPAGGGTGVFVRMDDEHNDRLSWGRFIEALESVNEAPKDVEPDAP